MRVEILNDERARRLARQDRRRIVRAAVQAGPSRGHRLEDDHDDIGRPAAGRHRPVANRIEVLQEVGGKAVGHPHRPVAGEDIPPGRGENPVWIVGHAPIVAG